MGNSRRSIRARRGAGQSLVELALFLPVILLVVLVTVDFGRALYGWVILQNSARIAANFAGANPDGWKGAGDPTVKADYELQLERDLNTANCQAPGTPPAPVFSDGPDAPVAGGPTDSNYDVGDTVVVSLTCVFRPVTPGIGAIVGANLTLGARSEFRIRAGDLVGLADPTKIPNPGTPVPTPTPAGSPTPTPTPTPTPGPTPTPTPAPTPTPTPACPGPSFTAVDKHNGGNPHRMDLNGSITPSSGGWSWTWSGGATATGQNVNNYDFPASGPTSVTLTVSKGLCTVSVTQTVNVP
jgi:hypothetical protein